MPKNTIIRTQKEEKKGINKSKDKKKESTKKKAHIKF